MNEYYGVLSGAAFTIAYSISGIFMGLLSDRFNRKKILGIACILWSLTQCVSSQTSYLSVFFLMRFFQGILQSANNPISVTILKDYFPQKNRAKVNSLYTSGKYIGSALSSFSVLLIKYFGWRATYNLMGLSGVAIGVSILLFVKNP
jgi:MFS family permease